MIFVCNYRWFGKNLVEGLVISDELSVFFEYVFKSLCVVTILCDKKANFVILFFVWSYLNSVCFLWLNLTELMCGIIWFGW